MWTKLSPLRATRAVMIGVIAILGALPAGVFAQAEDELGDEGDEPAAGPGQLPADPADKEEPKDGPEVPAKTVALPTPAPAAAPSPFTLTVKGLISGTMFAQDLPSRSGNGGGLIFGAISLPGTTDTWFLGGDVRQSQLMFSVKGPAILGGAIPNGVVEFDLLGGNQISSVPGSLAVVTIRDPATMMTIGTGTAPAYTSSAQGDESILPRVRLAYVELNWGMGTDVLRVGQYHNLLLPMIAASASHLGVPLGYGAGQLGWRAPGITYLHKFVLSETTNLSFGLQLNRNSWIDNAPACVGTQVPGPTANCLPSGISLGEASMLPQVEARLVLSGPPAPSPFPMYAPNAWQAHLVGHWDQKDLSGFGASAVAPMPDTMTTFVVEAGFKVLLGPVLVAANGWYGQNAGSVFGHIIQSQAPGLPDVTGFGAWGQAGLSFTKNLSLWFFAGIDKPDEAQARAAGFFFLQNAQLAGMLSYVDGPIVIAIEYMRTTTRNATAAVAPTATAPGMAAGWMDASANQLALSLAYLF